MSYPQALKLFNELRSQRQKLLQAVEVAIDEHVAKLSVVRSDQAGTKILPKFSELNEFCGAMTAQVFGIIMREHLKDDWVKTYVVESGKRVKYYNRRDD